MIYNVLIWYILKIPSRSSYLLVIIHFYCILLQVETRSPHSTTPPDYTGSATASTGERAASAGCGREQRSALFGWWLKVITRLAECWFGLKVYTSLLTARVCYCVTIKLLTFSITSYISRFVVSMNNAGRGWAHWNMRKKFIQKKYFENVK